MKPGGRLGAGLAVAATVALCAAGCAPRRVSPVAAVPAHPDYVRPSDPDTAGETASRLDDAWRFLQANDLRRASREVDAVLARAPRSPAALAIQGYVALAQRKNGVALDAFDASLAVRTGFVAALVGRGQALQALQRDADALGAFESALQGDPSLADVRRQVEVLRFRLVEAAIDAAHDARGRGRLDEARLRYDRALELSPDSAFLYRERAAVERDRGRADEAIADFRRALAIEPADVDGMTSLARLLASRGDLREADQLNRRAYAIEPSTALAAEVERVGRLLRDAGLPNEVRNIEARPALTRGELAALLGVRFEPLLRTVPPVQLVITDLGDDWARAWITSVAETGVMEPYANHTFQPAAPALRADLAAAAWRLLALAVPGRPSLRPYLVEQPRIADVAPTHPLYSAAASAVASGVMPLAAGERFEAARALSGAEAATAVRRLRTLLAIQ